MRYDTQMKKKASKVDKDRNESGWGSIIEGITTDNPRKLRGARVYNLIFEESGSQPTLIDTYVQSRALVFVGGSYRIGIRTVQGTAGDAANLTGLKTIFSNPTEYSILPYKHNYTRTGETTFTGYFIPAYTMWFGTPENPGFDSRGVVDEERAKKYYQDRWADIKDPSLLLKEKAEYCFTPEDAFVLEGSNVFNSEALAEQQMNIQQLKVVDPPKNARLYWPYNKEIQRSDPDQMPQIEYTPTGKIKIVEEPMRDETGHPFNNLYVIGCLTPGEKVLTSEGLKNCEDVTLNDKLYSIYGDAVDIINLQQYYKEGADIYKVKLNNIFRTTTFTGEHPIYCCTPEKHYRRPSIAKSEGLPYSYYKYNFGFKLMRDVKAGDFVKVPNIYKKEKPIPFEKWDESKVRIDRRVGNHLNDPDFWWLIGLLLGDGWAESGGKRVGVVFNTDELQYFEKTKSIVSRLFNRKTEYFRIRGKALETYINIQYLNEFFSQNFGRGAKNKCIPEWVKFLPADLKFNLVMGYLASDGCVCVKQKNLNFVSSSYELLEGMQDILFSLGIINTVHYLRSSKKYYKITNRNKDSEVSEAWTLEVHGAMLNKFKRMCPYNDLKLDKWQYKEFANHTIPRCFFEDDSCDYIYIKIRAIEQSKYTGVVYNYHCDTSTFMCKYIPTHNCDCIDAGSATSTGQTDVSKYCIVVLRRQVGLKPPKIVALYLERPDDIRDAHDTALKLAQFYNAKILFEATRVSIFQHFANLNKLHYFLRRPKATLGVSTRRRSQYGCPAVDSIIQHQIELIQNYVNDFSDQIDYLEVIDQLLRYSYENKRKFDIVAGLGMALLADEDLAGKVPKTDSSEKLLETVGYYKNEYGQKVFGVVRQGQGHNPFAFGWSRDPNFSSGGRTVLLRI